MRLAIEDILIENKFDIIFTTSPDQWELTLGNEVSRKYNIPLVADFRDIYEQEIGMPLKLRQRIQTQRFLYRRYITTRNAKLITTVSKYHKDVLSKKLSKNTEIVYNGYDESMFIKGLNKINSKKFKISYLGRILNLWYRNPELLLYAIDDLIDENKIKRDEISVDFYGVEQGILNPIISNLKDKSFVNTINKINFNEVPQILNQSELLLLLTNKGRKGILTTKFFEYAGIKKTIICIPGDEGELDEIIKNYNLGLSIDSKEGIKTYLMECINQWRTNTFSNHIESNVDFFSRKNQTKILSMLFNNIFNEVY